MRRVNLRRSGYKSVKTSKGTSYSMASLLITKLRRKTKHADCEALLNAEDLTTPLSSDTFDAVGQSSGQKKAKQPRRRIPTLVRLRRNGKEKENRAWDGNFEKNFVDLSLRERKPEVDTPQPSDVPTAEDQENDEYQKLLLTSQEEKQQSSAEAPSRETDAVIADLGERDVRARLSVDSVSAYILRFVLTRTGSRRRDSRLKDAALHVAVKRDLLDSIRILLEMEANVHAVNRKGETPLHVAVMNGSVDALTLLLEAGAAVNASDHSMERTPLDYAIDKVQIHGEASLAVVETLVEHGATFSHWNTQKLEDMCAKAIVNGFESLVELYLDNGCCPNACKNEHGLPLFAVAAKFGQVEIGKLLLKRGANEGGYLSTLFSALMSNQLHSVESHLGQEGKISALELDNIRCLRFAALEADMDSQSRKTIIGVLLLSGAEIDVAIDSPLNTVLHEAVQTDKLEVIQTLVALGADVNAQNRYGATPLMLAARTGNIEAAQILIQKGKAVIECRRNDGSQAVHVAVAAAREAMVQCLLGEGAPVNVARNDGVTPLQLAVKKSSPVIVKMLLDAGADMTTTRDSLIQDAMEREAIDVLELLFQRGRETSGPDPNAARRLPFACRLDKAAVAGFLLEAGADPNGDPDAEECPLQAAVFGRSRRSLKLLLEAGVDPNVKNRDGVPLTILAFRLGESVAVHSLVKSGKVDLTSTTPDGSHLLAEAVSKEDESMVSFLLKRGAPVHQVGATGRTPLREATAKSNWALTKLLLKAGADVSQDRGALLTNAIEKNDLEMLRLLHNAGIDFDQVDNDINSWLLAAWDDGRKDIVRFLLNAGADINKKRHGSKTPLMAAVLAKADCSFIEMLLDGGAHPDTFDDEVNTALHIAVSTGRIELVRVLLKHGADQFICNARLLNARQIARRHCFVDIIELLDQHLTQQEFRKRAKLSAGDDTHGQAISTERFWRLSRIRSWARSLSR